MRHFLPKLSLFLVLFIPSITTAAEKGKVQRSHAEVLKEFQEFGKNEYEAGKGLYNMVCASCHGDQKTPASVPNARLLHQQPLLNGSDPYSLYQTLTKGFNQMVPQTWMSNEQKYYMIHYLRETFFREDNPSQYTKIDEAYLASLPDETIAWPIERRRPWIPKKVSHDDVDQGPVLFGHFEASPSNVAPKGVIIGLNGNGVTDANHHALYDLDTGRLVAFNKGSLLDWYDLNYNGRHREHAKLNGDVVFESPAGLAWGHPGELTPGHYADFRDPREPALNGHFYGPLPNDLVQYKGLSLDHPTATLHFTVAGATVFERPSLYIKDQVTLFVRTIHVGPREETLHLRTHGKGFAHRLLSSDHKVAYSHHGGGINEGIVTINPSPNPVTLHFLAGAPQEVLKGVKFAELPKLPAPRMPTAESALFQNKKSSPDSPSVELKYESKNLSGPFQVEEASLPQKESNPWQTRIRLSGIDFLNPNTAALSSWTGDVFLLENIKAANGEPMRLSRIASGLHQPLGLKVRDGEIYVGCRDQIMRPHDFDGDAVTDYYEAFNTDHVLTMHFHEFAAGLDTGPDNEFYYVKCSQHADPAVIERHGTLIRVSPDGSKSEITATGLRSCNGCFIDEDGTAWLTDQEGFWNPQNKIMRIEPGGFHGNMLAWHDPEKISASDDDMVHPLVWLPKSYANSPSEVFRFPQTGWGPLSGSLGYYEYGKGKIMVLPHEEKSGQVQGLAHPINVPDFSTGIMRGRFHPDDQTLHACGLFSWGSTRTGLGGLYRIRPTGKPMHCITKFSASSSEIKLTFTEPLDQGAIDTSKVTLKSYTIKRSKHYGSKMENETLHPVENVAWSNDGKTATFTVPNLAPTRVLFIDLEIQTAEGPQTISASATIHEL